MSLIKAMMHVNFARKLQFGMKISNFFKLLCETARLTHPNVAVSHHDDADSLTYAREGEVGSTGGLACRPADRQMRRHVVFSFLSLTQFNGKLQLP